MFYLITDNIIIAAFIAVMGHIVLKIIDIYYRCHSQKKKELLELTNKIFLVAEEKVEEHATMLYQLLEEYLIDIKYITQIAWNVPEVYHLCLREAKRAIKYNKSNLNPTEFLPDLYTTLPRVYIQILPSAYNEEDLLYAETCRLFINSLLKEPDSLIVRSCDVIIIPLNEFIERGLYTEYDPDVCTANQLREGIILPDQSVNIKIDKLEKKLELLKDFTKIMNSKEELAKKVKEEMAQDVKEGVDKYIENLSSKMVEKAFKPFLKSKLKYLKRITIQKFINN